MNRFVGGPWIVLPILLSVVFAALFFPVVERRYDLFSSLMYTFAGLCVIWITYFIRVHIFTHLFANKLRKDDPANQA